jgi:hypothetical protein
MKSGTFSTYICISLAWWFHQKGKLTYLAVAGLWSSLSREFEIHNNLLLFQHLLLLLSYIVTRAIQSSVIVSRVEIFIVEFSLWCPKELSAIDPFNASLLNVLSHGVFWEFVIVVAEQVIIIQWTRVLILAIIEVHPVLSAAFLLDILIFVVVVLLLGIVGDDGACYTARLINVVLNWWPVDVCADRSC